MKQGGEPAKAHGPVIDTRIASSYRCDFYYYTLCYTIAS
jgi:hypothetical protein